MGILGLVMCMVSGVLVSTRLISYQARKLRIAPFPGLGVLVIGCFWLIWTVRELVSMAGASLYIGTFFASVQLLTFPVFVAIDITERKVPTSLVWMATTFVEVVLLVGGGSAALARSIMFAVALSMPFILANMARPGSIGAGDVRFCLFLGSILSYDQAPLVVPLCLIIAALMVLATASFLRLSVGFRPKSLPLLPFLVAAVLWVEFAPH